VYPKFITPTKFIIVHSNYIKRNNNDDNDNVLILNSINYNISIVIR